MDLRDNFQSRCPVRYNADGTHWYCKRQLSEKQEIESKTCNYSRCPGRELTYEEETQRLLQIESKMKDTKKDSKRDPIDDLMKRLKKEIDQMDAEEKLNQREASIVKPKEDQPIVKPKVAPIVKLKKEAPTIVKPKVETVIEEPKVEPLKEDNKRKEDPIKREQRLAKKREQERLRRERLREEKLKSQIAKPVEPEIIKPVEPETLPHSLEISKLEEEASMLESKALAIREKIASLKGEVKCEWKSCNNMIKVDPSKKKKYCSDTCRMNQNSLIYRKKIALRKKEIASK